MLNLLGSMTGRSIRSAIVIRHAQRCEITGAQAHWTCGLTQAGTEQAHAFGESLAGRFSSYRIFHSPVRRCEQTAMALSEELDGAPVSAEKMLGVFYIRVSVEEGFTEADRHGRNFTRAWFSGRVPDDIFMPLPEALAAQTAYIRSKFGSAPEGAMDIHITHDWNINVLREGIFGLRHEDAGWPGFLEGLAFSLQGNELSAAVIADGQSVRKMV